MRIKILNEATPSTKKPPPKGWTEDPMKKYEDKYAGDLQTRGFYMKFKGDRVKNPVGGEKHNAHEVAAFMMKKEKESDPEAEPVVNDIKLSSNPSIHKFTNAWDYQMVKNLLKKLMDQEEEMAAYGDAPEEVQKAMERKYSFKDKGGSQTGKPVAGRMTGLEIAQEYKNDPFSKMKVRYGGEWQSPNEATDIKKILDYLGKTAEEEPEPGIHPDAIKGIPELIKKYMVKKYKFIGQPASPGKGDEVKISGLEIAEEFWKKPSKAIWVTNEDEGMWERAHEHPETIKIIDWLENEVTSGQHPKDFAADLKKSFKEDPPDWAADLEKAPKEPEEDTGDRLTARHWFMKVDDTVCWTEECEGMYHTDAGDHQTKFSAMMIAKMMNDGEEGKDFRIRKVGSSDRWKEAGLNPDIKEAIGIDNEGRDEEENTRQAEDNIQYHINIAGMRWTKGGVSVTLTPIEIAKKMNDKERVPNTTAETWDEARVLVWTQGQGEWKSAYQIPAIKRQLIGAMKLTKDIKTIGDIIVRIGTKDKPCKDFSPANDRKPFGNSVGDPYMPKSIGQGKWECDTESEHVALMAIEYFVTQNNKIAQDVVNDIIEVSRDSEPGEPLHPEDDGVTLFRGTSREILNGKGPPTAAEVLKNINWDSFGSGFQEKMQKDRWISFEYGGEFHLKWAVASWTDNKHTASGFAKGGPSLNMAGARNYQFIYEVTPSKAKDVGGTFIDFELLYQLKGNDKAHESGVGEIFSGFSSYKTFDEETLLLGQEGGMMPIDRIWVNWDFLTSRQSMVDIEKELPEIHEKIAGIMEREPSLKKTKGVHLHWEKWRSRQKQDLEKAWIEWNQEWEEIEAKLENVEDFNHSGEAKKAREVEHKLQKSWPLAWFDSQRRIMAALREQWDMVVMKGRFEHEDREWNQDPDNPWYKVKYEDFIDATKSRAIATAIGSLKKLEKEIRKARALIWPSGTLPDGHYYFSKDDPDTEVLEEEEVPWYKSYRNKEIEAGMRGTLTGKDAGNKYIPAKGMKNIPTNNPSKSPAAGAGALEEGCSAAPMGITLKIR